MDYKLVTKWKDAIRYIQQGHKKNAKNYSYTLIQRAMHIDGLSSLKSNVLRINAGTDKKNGVDFYVSYDVVNGVVPKVPKEYSFLTCGLNLMILGQ